MLDAECKYATVLVCRGRGRRQGANDRRQVEGRTLQLVGPRWSPMSKQLHKCDPVRHRWLYLFWALTVRAGVLQKHLQSDGLHRSADGRNARSFWRHPPGGKY